MNTVVFFFQSLFCSAARWVAMVIGIVWVWLEPTLPYAEMCAFAVLIDCLTAWRLNRRIKAYFPNAEADGKLKSARMVKMISDLAIVWLCILLADGVDDNLLNHLGNLHLGQYVAAIFVLCTAVSILENESSCNGAMWATAVQKIVTSKVARHIDISEEELEKVIKSQKHE